MMMVAATHSTTSLPIPRMALFSLLTAVMLQVGQAPSQKPQNVMIQYMMERSYEYSPPNFKDSDKMPHAWYMPLDQPIQAALLDAAKARLNEGEQNSPDISIEAVGEPYVSISHFCSDNAHSTSWDSCRRSPHFTNDHRHKVVIGADETLNSLLLGQLIGAKEFYKARAELFYGRPEITGYDYVGQVGSADVKQVLDRQGATFVDNVNKCPHHPEKRVESVSLYFHAKFKIKKSSALPPKNGDEAE